MKTATVFLILLLSMGTAMAYEEPRYDVIKQYPDFELRQYAPYVVAETTVTGNFDGVGSEAFRILFAYISGDNRSGTDIPMTAPVNQRPLDEKGLEIAMTAPVVQSPRPGEGSTYVYSFIMPSSFTMETLPQPIDPRISLRAVGAKRMAVRTYSGSWSEKRYRYNEALLLRALETEGLVSAGPPVFARYNSPFTLWFLRRNEVLVEVQ